MHPVFENDPRKLHSMLHKSVVICTKGNEKLKGFVKTIDPVTESFILVQFDSTLLNISAVILVPGFNIVSVCLSEESPTPLMLEKIESLFRRTEEEYTKEEVDRRRDALCVWLKENRVPYTMREDSALEVLQFAVITPPYSVSSVTCTNEVVLDKLLKLLQECPDLHTKPLG